MSWCFCTAHKRTGSSKPSRAKWGLHCSLHCYEQGEHLLDLLVHCHPPEELVVLLDFQALGGVLTVLKGASPNRNVNEQAKLTFSTARAETLGKLLIPEKMIMFKGK